MTIAAKGASITAGGMVAAAILAAEGPPDLTGALVLVASALGVSTIVLGALGLFGRALVNHFVHSMETSLKKLESVPERDAIEKGFSRLTEELHATRHELLAEIKSVDAKYSARESTIGELRGRVSSLEQRVGR